MTSARKAATKDQKAKNAGGGQASAAEAMVSRWAPWLLTLAIVAIRFWGLGTAPGGPFLDESSIGYNAWCILQTGADEHGVRFPLYFRAFEFGTIGEFKNPVLIYALVPLIAAFGTSAWVLRFGAALFGLGAAVCIGLAAAESVERKRWGWAAFLIAATMPWLFALSRVAFEAIAFPFLIALAWWSWSRAVRSDALGWYLLSWSAWGVSLFSYSTARLLTPALVLALLFSYLPALRQRPRRPLWGSIPFLACLAVLLIWSVRHPGSLSAKFSALGIWQGDPVGAAVSFVTNYLGYFSPQFLFAAGDSNLRHHTGHGGELFLFIFPALLAGLFHAWQRRGQAAERFVLLGFALFPLAASLLREPSHAIRSLNAVPFVAVLAMWGFQGLWPILRGRRILAGAFLVFALWETSSYFLDYFSAYRYRSAAWFGAGLPEAVRYALENRRGDLYYSPLAFRDETFAVNQPYIHFLFEGKLDAGIYRRSGLEGFGIRPYQEGAVPPPGSLLLLKDAEALLLPDRRPVLTPNPGIDPSKGTLVHQVAVPSKGESRRHTGST